jgi:hypothetical protein
MLLDSSVRAIAHFNLAVECEFLNQLDTAALHYNMYSPALFYFYYICLALRRSNRTRSGRSRSPEATVVLSLQRRTLSRARL